MCLCNLFVYVFSGFLLEFSLICILACQPYLLSRTHIHTLHTQHSLDDTGGGLIAGASGSQENLLSPSNEVNIPSNPFAPSTPPTDLESREAFVSEQPATKFNKFKRLSRNKFSPNPQRKPQFKGQLKPSPENGEGMNGGVTNEGEQVNFEPSEPQESKLGRRNRKSM